MSSSNRASKRVRGASGGNETWCVVPRKFIENVMFSGVADNMTVVE